MLHIALFEPKIPQNTGNIIRLTANTGFSLHIIGPIDFKFDDKNLKRAGLDYHDLANVRIHDGYENFLKALDGRRILGLSTKGTKYYHEIEYRPEDILLFGSETSGLPPSVRDSLGADNLLRVPMKPNNRSMNLANTVALTSFEAWRQLGFSGAI